VRPTSYSELLFAEPSFLDGFARVLDLGGVFDDDGDSLSGPEADWLALASDWYAVGADLHHAINRQVNQVSETATHARRPGSR